MFSWGVDMAEIITFETKKRSDFGTQSAKKLRRQGQVPVVLYGHKEETLTLTLPTVALEHAIRHGARVVDLKTDGNMQKALIREVQWDCLGKELLHVDFYRVSADERVVVSVPIEIRGTAPGIAGGGVLDQPLHSLSVECLAIAVPNSIRVNVGEMLLGSIIHIREVVLPEGVKAMQDPDAIVVQVVAKQTEEVTPAAGAPLEVGPAEPERIGRVRAEEEEPE